MNKIPLVDLKSQYFSIKDEMQAAINAVLDEASFILGHNVKSFEEEFAQFCGVKHGIGVANGTEALMLALRACGIGEGDEVITAPNTFIATVEAITMNRARVVFVDISPDTYTIDVSKIEEKITPKTKAVIPIHLYGHPADMDPINKIAKKYKLTVIEDAAQSHGAKYKGQTVGKLGNVACFSFYPGKNLGAYGDGGAVVTDDPEIMHEVTLLRNHGRMKKYEHEIEGFNSRLDEIQAAVLRVKLRHLNEWNVMRRQKASLYNRLLSQTGIILPKVQEGVDPVYHLYVVRTENRDKLQAYLLEKGISTGIHYPYPLHLQKAYQYLNYSKGDFPVSEKCAEGILSLPMYPELSDDHVERICSEIVHCMKN